MEKETEQEEIQTVGAMLREARLKAGKTEADIAEELCIRKSYVIAIEEMDFANIPPSPFGVGFIRNYADLLGLNSDRIVSSYRQSSHEKKEDRISAKVENSGGSYPHFKHIFIGLCGLAALFVIWSVLPISEPVEDYRDENIDIPEPVIVADEETATETEATVAEDVADADTEAENVSETENNDLTEPEDMETPVETEAEDVDTNAEETAATIENTEETADNIPAEEEQPASEFHKMRMVLKGPSWVEVKQGDKTILRGSVYKRGFSYNIPQEKGLTVTVGRPQNAVFYVDEKPTRVVSVMNSKRVSLDEFLMKKDN